MNSATQSFLGRYRLVKVLGQGAMGVVYEAADTRLGRTVAIKTVLRSHMVDETTATEYASRFEREAQAAARLSHPHVVTVFDFGEHEDISYIVMEFVRGRELNQIFESGEKFSLAESIRIMCELLQALDYAHRQGVVHRDVKPANVLIDGAGRVKLTDFGVARVTNAGQDRTMPGTLVGTPSYMSPEQILGLAVGSRADIFAAGVILYQFLTGKRPFSGGGPFGVQRKIVQDDPEPPSQLNPDLPPGFDAIVSRSLAKQPEDRYESAAIFAADLERIAATLARDVPLIDLDFTEAPTTSRPATSTSTRSFTLPPPASPAPPPPKPAPKPAPPADDALGLTLITEVPFGGPVPAPQPGSPAPPPFDPDSTVIMFRPPTVPPPSAGTTATQRSMSAPPSVQPAVPPPAQPAPSPTATLSSRTSATTRPLPSALAAGAAAGRTSVSPVPASPPLEREPEPATMRVPAYKPPAAPARQAAPPRAAPRQAANFQGRRSFVPLAVGAALSAVALGVGLMVAWPGSHKPAAEGSPGPAASAAAATPQPATTTPALPQPSPPPAATGAAQSGVGEPASAAAESQSPPAAASPTAGDVAGAAPQPNRASPTQRPPAHGAPVRRLPSEPSRPATRPESRSDGLEPRCADLLQRMQLGEPLSPEQTSYFQTRCTR